jgi:hypothetical protein
MLWKSELKTNKQSSVGLLILLFVTTYVLWQAVLVAGRVGDGRGEIERVGIVGHSSVPKKVRKSDVIVFLVGLSPTRIQSPGFGRGLGKTQF